MFYLAGRSIRSNTDLDPASFAKNVSAKHWAPASGIFFSLVGSDGEQRHRAVLTLGGAAPNSHQHTNHEGEVRSPCCHHWPCTSGSCGVTENLGWAPFRKLSYSLAAIRSSKATLISLKHSIRYRINIMKRSDKKWLQSGADGAERAQKAAELRSICLQIRAPIMKETTVISRVWIYTVLFWAGRDI